MVLEQPYPPPHFSSVLPLLETSQPLNPWLLLFASFSQVRLQTGSVAAAATTAARNFFLNCLSFIGPRGHSAMVVQPITVHLSPLAEQKTPVGNAEAIRCKKKKKALKAGVMY